MSNYQRVHIFLFWVPFSIRRRLQWKMLRHRDDQRALKGHSNSIKGMSQNLATSRNTFCIPSSRSHSNRQHDDKPLDLKVETGFAQVRKRSYCHLFSSLAIRWQQLAYIYIPYPWNIQLLLGKHIGISTCSTFLSSPPTHGLHRCKWPGTLVLGAMGSIRQNTNMMEAWTFYQLNVVT